MRARADTRSNTQARTDTQSWETPVNYGLSVIYILPLSKQRSDGTSPGGLPALRRAQWAQLGYPQAPGSAAAVSVITGYNFQL